MFDLLLQTATPTSMPDGGWFFRHGLPPEWQWLGLVLAALALVLGLVAAAQMIWGGPRLSIRFGEYQIVDDERKEVTPSLVVQIFNRPIAGLPKFIGVRRGAAEEVIAEVRTVREDTNAELIRGRPTIKIEGGVHGKRIRLPASVVPAEFLVAMRLPDGRVALDAEPNPIGIYPGSYCCNVSLTAGHIKVTARNSFVVPQAPGVPQWVSTTEN